MSDEKQLLDEAITQAEAAAVKHDGTALGEENLQRFKWLSELREIKYPTPIPEGSNVVSLDDHRIRSEGEFKDEMVAFVECMWGRESYAFNVAIRDLEGMRRGADDKALRHPQTYHEALHMILHTRGLANDIARHFGLTDLVRPVDDLGTEEKPDEPG